ncbi:TaqI-like C-terminal specificity domain-containing protein [Helicobacter mesocricetorum]|uniref:TaqI-like C-terminal specificity domain-containing protein n=1 Tax=Helicobacter mesocricetorum TaxID=87012 RepID=UPI0013150B1A|nr:TaqI-like C-terminal specificity domain-containing protein [Helicobacter mesocricetorum]
MPQKQYEGKIIYPETTQSVNFMLDKMGYFLDKTAFMIKGGSLEYLNAVLASKMAFWYLKQICNTLGASGFSMSKIFVEKLPVVETNKIDSKLLAEIEDLAGEILTKSNSKINHTNAQAEAVEMRNCGFQARNKGVTQAVMTEVEGEESAVYRSNATLKELESRLDSLIYQAYNLNQDEIALIESAFNSAGGGGINAYLEAFNSILDTFILNTLERLEASNLAQKHYQGKIIWAEMTNTPCFVYESQGFYINQTCYFIPRDDMYLCAVLNSKLIYFYMRQIASGLGDGAFRWIKQFIEKLPVIEKNATNEAKIKEIKALATQIIALQQENKDIHRLESKLDSMIYQLYNLNQDEINLIESAFNSAGGGHKCLS